MEQVKLSVIVPAYNVELYLRECLASIVSQRVNFVYEVICCDDCSQDKSLDIIKEYQKKFPKIVRFVENKKNLGSAKTSYELHKIAKGQYIAWIDGDDYLIDANRFQEQVDFLDSHKNFSAVSGNSIIKYQDGSPDDLIVKSAISKEHSVEDVIMAKVYFHTSAIMYRNLYKDRVPKFFSHKYGNGDWLRTILHASLGKVGYIDKIVSVYRIHKQGEWSRMNDFEKNIRNTDACIYFNKFLDYKYDALFSRRIKIFIEHIFAQYESEFGWFKNIFLKSKYKILLKRINMKYHC